ncbi:MAG: heparinase II/III family protein [Clostridia bacterium]|nr:heparinase II/III family protein [Clostridia bacterium]
MSPIPHPNFRFSAAEIDALKKQIATDPVTGERYRKIIEKNDKILREDFITEAFADSVFDQHGKYGDVARQLGRMNGTLGTAWLIGRDEKSAEKLKELLLHVAGFKYWRGPDNPYQPVPRRSELNTASISLAMAYGYDILYDCLSADERAVIAKAIIQKGVMPLLEDWVLPATRIHAVDSMGHNWWAVCVAAGGAALLPVQDHLPGGEAERLMDAAEEALIQYLRYPGCTLFNKPRNYDDKGLFYESVAYFSYGTGELLQYLYLAERYRPRREALRAALPDRMDKAVLAFAYPSSGNPRVQFLNYGDSSTDCNICGLMHNLVLCGYGTRAVGAYNERLAGGWGLFDLLHPELRAPGDWDELENVAFFPDSGYAVARDGWHDDATLFSVKSGFTWNHAHADAGHFVLWDKGAPLVVDGGTCGYKSPLYRTYYCTDAGHNVLLIGGKGQNPEDQYRGNKFPGRLFDTFTGRDFVYVGADATGPVAHLCSRMYRNFIWIENRILVVVDDVRTHTEETIQFLLHHDGKWAKTEGDVPATDITGEKSAAKIWHLFPADIKVTEETGCTVETEDGEKQDVRHLQFSTVTPARSHLLMHVFVLRPEENPVLVERLTDTDALGVELRETDTGVRRRIWFNLQADGRRMHLNSNNLIDGMETDAYLFMRTFGKDGEKEVFLATASYYRKPGIAGFADLTKRTALYTPEN